jgi:glycosyltransferase involved in cell wall biosynthesis
MNTIAPAGNRVDVEHAAHRSLRIAVVTETYPPEVNGVALTMARVVEGLHRRGNDLQLIRPRQQAGETVAARARFEQVLVGGLPIPRYPNLRMGLPAGRALRRLWQAQRPDVVHIATEGPLGWSALQAARALGLPVSSDFRTNFDAYSQHYGIGCLMRPIRGYLRAFHNRATCTMVPTEGLRRDLEAAGFERLNVVTRGVDTRLFMPHRRSQALREQWGAGPEDLVVMCVGRLAAEKNLGVLLSAHEAIRQVDPNARLVLVGDGPQRVELQARCPQAVFAGQRRGDDLAAHYASADLFLFPSLTETFGNVTTEAMASGLPVLAFAYAAAAQLIRHGKNGALSPVNDTAAFVRAAAELAIDAAQRRDLGLQARKTAEALDWDSIVTRFEGVLRQAMQSTDAPCPVTLPAGQRHPAA